MKLGIIGETGKTGQALLDVAMQQDLTVTAIVRNASLLTQNVPILEKDIFDLTSSDLSDFDAVICTFDSGKKTTIRASISI